MNKRKVVNIRYGFSEMWGNYLECEGPFSEEVVDSVLKTQHRVLSYGHEFKDGDERFWRGQASFMVSDIASGRRLAMRLSNELRSMDYFVKQDSNLRRN